MSRPTTEERIAEALQRVVAARNNLRAASGGRLPAESVVPAAATLLDQALEWLEGAA